MDSQRIYILREMEMLHVGDQCHGNLTGPPKKYGPNKALLRETNG